MALAVRQAVMKTAAAQAVQQTSLAAWHDAAIKEFVQNEKGFLANITVIASPIDTIAAFSEHEAPDNIARLGFAIAHLLNATVPPVPGLTEREAATAKNIAGALQRAKRPVVISGTSCYNEGIIKAAFNISLSLNQPDRKAGIAYVLPECNSMGLAMMKAPPFETAMQRVKAENNCTAVILENDLYRYMPENRADDFITHCGNLIVLDMLHNRTTAQAQVLIPAASFAEADGTLVNNEGRAQHFYQVYMPANDRIKESWKWLGNIKNIKATITNGLQHHPDEWLAALETALPQFENITKVTPPHNFRINGQPVPREPHRYSGRTAMLANIAVSEPRPLQDNDSPLTYTMEGYPGLPPASMTPYFWAPGWNSGQAVNKYQAEPGGELKEQDQQVCLFPRKGQENFHFFKDSPEAFASRQGKYLLLPQYQLFGSGELSIYSTEIEELVPQACIILSAKDAADLGVVNGAPVTIEKNDLRYTLPLKIHDELCSGIILAPVGYRGIPALPWGAWVKIMV